MAFLSHRFPGGFGGKSKVAPQVWAALGDVQNYVEPFFGSGAVLFARPHEGNIETVNDIDHFLANFWRAAKHDPAGVAHWAYNPVNEDDLTARHIWLVKHGMPMLDERIPADPDFYDAKISGWWVWGICSWIGGGWCTGNGPWTEVDGKIVKMDKGEREAGVSRRLVHLNMGQGVNRQLVHLGDAGQGVNRKLVHLFNAGIGVNRPKSAGEPRSEESLTRYFEQIADRLKNVRVCSGDWSRVVTNGALAHGSSVGVFLDPPYDMGIRDDRVYNHDTDGLAQDVLAWCKTNGTNPRYRIVLAGYDGEHNDLEQMGWRVESWSAGAAYQTANGGGANAENLHKERLWYSLNCLNVKPPELW